MRTKHGLKRGDRIAVLTSGGDAPGMNAAVSAVVRVATTHQIEVFGVQWGYQGLIKDSLTRLGLEDVDGWSRRGGTQLGTSRSPEFRTQEGRTAAASILQRHGIRGLIVIGGNGSLTGAHAFRTETYQDDEPFLVMGIPASIDNDLGLTTMAIGTDTAMNTIVNACDRILDTASAHGRTFVVEVMGRDCGFLAITCAIAAGADGVLFREAQLDYQSMLDKLVSIVKKAYDPDRGRNRVLILKSEGVELQSAMLKAKLDQDLQNEGLPIETRVTVLGHVVRGGAPSAFDRLLANRFAHAAVVGLIDGRTDEMVGWHVLYRPKMTRLDIFEIDPYISYWPLGTVLAETEKLKDGSSIVTQWRVRALRQAEPILSA